MKTNFINRNSSHCSLLRQSLLLAACLFTAQAVAQANDVMTPIAAPDQSNAIELGTGPLPQAKAQESWHSQYGSRFARNVTVATLTPFLPDAKLPAVLRLLWPLVAAFALCRWTTKAGMSPKL